MNWISFDVQNEWTGLVCWTCRYWLATNIQPLPATNRRRMGGSIETEQLQLQFQAAKWLRLVSTSANCLLIVLSPTPLCSLPCPDCPLIVLKQQLLHLPLPVRTKVLLLVAWEVLLLSKLTWLTHFALFFNIVHFARTILHCTVYCDVHMVMFCTAVSLSVALTALLMIATQVSSLQLQVANNERQCSHPSYNFS